jgi:hypothetical protein
VHPIGVELVLYATQRTESVLCIVYLSAVLLLARAAVRGLSTRRDVASMLGLALLGAGSKEVFATAPLLALFYDRAFFAGTFAGALRARKALYLALAFTFVPIALLHQTHPRPYSVRFFELDYLVAQAQIIPEYLGAALWPVHSVFDYGPLLPQDARAALPWIVLTSVLVLVATGLAFV